MCLCWPMKQSPALRSKTCRVTTRARGIGGLEWGRVGGGGGRAAFHFCGCRHVRATSWFCILSRELTVQLTGQVSVPLLFVLSRFLLCAPHCTCQDLRMCLSPFISLSFLLPRFAPCSSKVTVWILIILSYLIVSHSKRHRRDRHDTVSNSV